MWEERQKTKYGPIRMVNRIRKYGPDYPVCPVRQNRSGPLASLTTSSQPVEPTLMPIKQPLSCSTSATRAKCSAVRPTCCQRPSQNSDYDTA